MPIRADHLTLARLVFLPAPLVMLYREGSGWTLAALATLVLLGLTDVFDGPLARKYGSTRFGQTLDGVADRAFIAVLYSVFADLGIVSTVGLAILVGRELFVVKLRGIATESARVGRAGKLKTTVQMIGAGFLLLLWIFAAGPWIHAILGAAVAVSLILLIASWRRRGEPDWRALWATGLTLAIALARLSLPAAATLHAVEALIVGITLATGAALAWSVRREASDRLGSSPAALVGLLGATLAIPLGWIPLMGSTPLLSLAAAGTGAAELTLIGLANAMAGAGAPPRQEREIARSLLLGVAGATARFLAGRPHSEMVVSAIVLVTLIWLGVEVFERVRRMARL